MEATPELCPASLDTCRQISTWLKRWQVSGPDLDVANFTGDMFDAFSQFFRADRWDIADEMRSRGFIAFLDVYVASTRLQHWRQNQCRCQKTVLALLALRRRVAKIKAIIPGPYWRLVAQFVWRTRYANVWVY